MAYPTTKPGDLVGHDSSGRVRIDRVIPLPWLLGGVGAIALQGVALYYAQQQTAEAVREMKSQLTAIVAAQTAAQVADADSRADLRELRRRVEALEARRP